MDTTERAVLSAGISNDWIYRMVSSALADVKAAGVAVDFGCGTGNLHRYLPPSIHRYIGVDVFRHPGFPEELEFHPVDLDTGRSNLDDDFADVTLAVETIEHLENPRAFLRELTRVTKPGGCVIVTTPNQLSLLSLLSLVVKGHYAAFLDPCYPAHITALLETDLRRIATECGLQVLGFRFSHNGRIPGSGLSWPPLLSKLSPRRFSDNLLLLAQKP